MIRILPRQVAYSFAAAVAAVVSRAEFGLVMLLHLLGLRFTSFTTVLPASDLP